jgi:hypothetical protein
MRQVAIVGLDAAVTERARLRILAKVGDGQKEHDDDDPIEDHAVA